VYLKSNKLLRRKIRKNEKKGNNEAKQMKKREREGGGLSHPIEDFLTDTYSSLDVVSFEVHPPMSLQRRGDYGDKDDALDERESKMERKKKRRKRLHDRARKSEISLDA